MSQFSQEGAQRLINVFPYVKDSVLFAHEIAYTLGQMKQEIAIEFLIENLNNEENSPVVWHECGEALANFPEHKEKVLPVLVQWKDSEIPIVRSTIRLAIRKLEEFHTKARYAKFNLS